MRSTLDLTQPTAAGSRWRAFRPAFRDAETGCVYYSRFADGRSAAVHVLDGLPDEVVLARTPGGRVKALKGSVVAGYVCEGSFYTREEAMREREAVIEALLSTAG